MKAVILAAGKGNRLYPLTRDKPKPLLKTNGQTILEHQVQNLRSCGINDIVMVTGYQAPKIEAVYGAEIRYIFNPFYETTNSLVSLWLARNELNDDLIYLHSDVVFDRRILEELLEVRHDFCLTVDKKNCLEEDMKVTANGKLITEINKTMAISQAYGEFIGIARFSRDGARILSATLDRIVREGELMLWFESSVQRLIDERQQVYKCDTSGKPWIEIDFPHDLEKAQREIYPAITAQGNKNG
jgi:choline kinase